MNIFRKRLLAEVPDIQGFTPPALSEEMVRRDNYFHSCWMELKQKHPDLWETMTDIELDIAGYIKEDKKDSDDETDTNAKNQGTVL
ncbi:unnamed protein product [marine sediment metagenome]|uniref:Uncharacterized protein n=1 Tax=marine sediment metagenome TaxID=412755 RepID=X0YD35_9ZZZZ